MKSYAWRDFVFDIGRKELYSRIPEVDRLWRDVLGADYREYPHRVGSLYSGQILELSSKPRGLFRGFPLPWLVRGAASLLWGAARSVLISPRNYEQYWYARTGRVFASLLAQGYWEKFRGQRWANMPVPDENGFSGRSYSLNAIGKTLGLARRGGVSSQQVWRHPAMGTGQLPGLLLQRIQKRDVPVLFGTEVRALRKQNDDTYAVTVTRHGSEKQFLARTVISSLSVEELHTMLGTESASGLQLEPPPDAARGVILVYLFLNEPPRFPHAWLEVNDVDLKCGRITNYAGFGGKMVPRGKTCVCVEFFTDLGDPLNGNDDLALGALASAETARHGLIDPREIVHTIVKRLLRTNAAASWREQQNASRSLLFDRLAEHPRLYHVNRPGTDWATFAGMLAAKAILEGDRSEFDSRGDPRRRLAGGKCLTYRPTYEAQV